MKSVLFFPNSILFLKYFFFVSVFLDSIILRFNFLHSFLMVKLNYINQNYYQILCFSMSNYLNAYKQFVFILTVALWLFFFSLKFCVVYLNLTGYQMKA